MAAHREWVVVQLQSMRREADMRADAEEKIRAAESSRIDAIRAVDVGNVSVAAERQSAAANVLATQVVASAEALRNQFVTATGQLSDRITLLERSSYEGQGKSTATDPMMTNLLAEVKILQGRTLEQKGSNTGMSQLIGWSAAAIGAIVAIASFAMRGLGH